MAIVDTGPTVSPQAPPRQQIVLWGDSITNDNINTGGGSVYSYDSPGYWTWASMLLGHRFQVVNVAGHGGFTTANLLPTLAADVTAYAPAWVLVEVGINDVTNDIAAATTIANLTTIYNTFLAAGVRVIALTLPPSVNVNTTARRTALYTINAFIRAYAQQHSNIVLVDWYPWIADPTSSAYIANYSSDGVHPSPLGAYWMGQAIAAVLQPLTFPNPPLPMSNIDPTNQLCTNPMMLGNVAGIATSWAFQWQGVVGAVAHSKVVRTDGIQGEWQQAAISGAPTVAANYQFGPITTGWAVGSTVYAATEFQLDAGSTYFGAGAVPVKCSVLCNGAATEVFDMRSQSSYISPPAGIALSGVLRTPNFVIPAGTTQLYLRMYSNCLGTVRFGRSQVFLASGVWG